MLKTLTVLTCTTLLSLYATPLLKTGQTLSYDGSGNIIAKGNIKDDGYYQAGATRSYSRNEDSVIDNITGLQWQDNESVSKQWLTQENYDAGQYNDITGDTAASYCTALRLGGHSDWRLPSIGELETLIDYGKTNPTLSSDLFQNSIADTYWSSTTSAEYNDEAWRVFLDYGYSNYYSKDEGTNVRCVRDASKSEGTS